MANGHDGKSRILLFGYDLGLLLTRQLLLERNGYQVHVVTTLRDFRTCVLCEAFDLILLCQSRASSESGGRALCRSMRRAQSFC